MSLSTLLLMDDHSITLLQWVNGAWHDRRFATDADALDSLITTLVCHRWDVGVLVDLDCESVVHEPLPRLSWLDRRALCRRKAAQHWPQTAHRHIGPCRLHAGRHVALLSALIQPAPLDALLDRLTTAGIAISGVWSLPLLISALVTGCPAHSLLFCVGQDGRLRQSHLVHGQLQFSRRLQRETRPPADTADALAAVLDEETRLAQRHLAGTAQLPSREALTVVILGTGEAMPATAGALNRHWASDGALHAVALSLPVGDVAAAVADRLRLRPPPSHYGTSRQLRRGMLRRRIATIRLIAASLLLAASLQAWHLQRAGAALAHAAAGLSVTVGDVRRQTAALQQGLPIGQPVAASQLAAIRTLDARYLAPWPRQLADMQRLSQALLRYPALQIERYGWEHQLPAAAGEPHLVRWTLTGTDPQAASGGITLEHLADELARWPGAAPGITLQRTGQGTFTLHWTTRPEQAR
ncbi:hypothetical protein N8I74_18360 [Chitiniphilus purpureus]|uniref:PilN domain-containing protein n=1 Tax=Chitiniphilus purpureus TaxID=2981137 RepID=A0ABY6DP42_9NEIS|nr:hypothetical protein [Chitiniphilus sp. CD1]UXY15251.1 hypothetical protein N8I74_18360 [Chitiniphilus sp. CD1]